MANQITDGRTNVSTAESAAAFDDLAGATSGTVDDEIFFEGLNSVGYSTQNAIDGLLFDAGSAQDWSNNVFYLLVNCGIVGLLATKANSGLTIRFCGATVTDWFEFKVAGSDSWPASVAGGWTLFVVDIEATASTTNGTTPATSAIQYVGISTITAGTMPRMVDNTWLDQITRLPDGSPGIIVEGRNAGSTDWNWADVIGAADTGAWGTARLGPGGSVVLSTSVQFGINDTSTHGFDDTNQVILWDDQEFIPDDLYSLSALGNSGGTTDVTAGIKTGTGDDATGAQGWVVTAAPAGARWSMDFNDVDLDAINFSGCTFQHAGTLSLDDAAVEVISSFYIDCTALIVGAGLQQRCTIVAANTADDVSFADVTDPTRVKFCDFQFSDGHALEILSATGSPWTFSGNLFTGYGADASTDAAILIDGLTATLNIAALGDTPTKKEITAASLTINNNKTVTFTGMRDNSEVRVYRNDTGVEVAGIEDATAGTADARTFAWSAAAGLEVNYVIHNWQPGVAVYQTIDVDLFTVPSSDLSIAVNQAIDRNAV